MVSMLLDSLKKQVKHVLDGKPAKQSGPIQENAKNIPTHLQNASPPKTLLSATQSIEMLASFSFTRNVSLASHPGKVGINVQVSAESLKPN